MKDNSSDVLKTKFFNPRLRNRTYETRIVGLLRSGHGKKDKNPARVCSTRFFYKQRVFLTQSQ